MEKEYAEMLKAGLEDAVAFIDGDTSRGRVVVREIPGPDSASPDGCKVKSVDTRKNGRTQ